MSACIYIYDHKLVTEQAACSTEYTVEESGGGTGQGLYSNHLAAVYKHNHAFIDPNLWHNEDELRKQLEMFSSAWILTAQEKPDSHRKFREDLYKKLVSADDLAARKPYGYVTRMLRVIGWKRVETNDLLEFKNVSEESFNSIFRRSLVWKAKALFVEEEYIRQRYPDAAEDGIFPKDPTLKAFLESGPAILASLRHQLGFELQHSREACRNIIEDCASAGFTEKKIRQACGLAERPPTNKPPALVAAETADVPTTEDGAPGSEADQEKIIPEERLVVDEVIKLLLSQKINKAGMVTKISESWFKRNCKGARFGFKTNPQSEPWQRLMDGQFVVKTRSWQNSEQYFPCVRAKNDATVLCDLRQPSAETVLEEQLNLSMAAAPERRTSRYTDSSWTSSCRG